MWVAALNLYYLKLIHTQVDQAFKAKGFEGDQDVLSYLMILAGSYNLGPDILKKLARNTTPIGKGEDASRSIKKWCQILSEESTETQNYMLSVRRCMTKGVFSNPTRTKAGECAGGKDHIPETTDPCEPLKPIFKPEAPVFTPSTVE